MYRGYKIVPFIPAGRKRTMRILLNHLLANKGLVDQVQIWRNTRDWDDLDYIKSLEKDPFYKVLDLPIDIGWDDPKQLNTGKFYRYATDAETIYLRFDDDIVYLEPDYFKNMLDFRIDHPDYFLVFGNIWNNAIISYIHQKEGRIGTDHGTVEDPWCMDQTGWNNPEYAEYIHDLMLKAAEKGKAHKFFMDKVDYPLHEAQRFSISNFAYFGKDFQKFGGQVKFDPPESAPPQTSYLDEEIWLTEYFPKKSGRLNAICGNALCVHFTFRGQRKHILEKTDFLDRYWKLSQQAASNAYYNLLES